MKKNIRYFCIILTIITLILVIPNIVNAASGVTKEASSCTTYTRTNHYLFEETVDQTRADACQTGGRDCSTTAPDAVNDATFYHDKGMSEDWEIVGEPIIKYDLTKTEKEDLINMWMDPKGWKSVGDANYYVLNNNNYYFSHGFGTGSTELITKIVDSGNQSLIDQFKKDLSDSTVGMGSNGTGIKVDNLNSLLSPNSVSFKITKNIYAVTMRNAWLAMNTSYYTQQVGMDVGEIGDWANPSTNCPSSGSEHVCTGSVISEFIVDLKREVCSYTVTYDVDSDDANNAPSTHTKSEGSCINIKSTIPTREGYTFQYWVDDENNRYDPGDKYCLDENLDLKAVWKKNSSGEIITPGDSDGKSSDNDVKSPGTGVGIAYGLIATVVLGSTIAIIYVRRRNKFENI